MSERKHFDEGDRPFIVAIDLDGTLFDNNDGWNGISYFGKTNKKVKKLIKKLDDVEDLWIVIWTCRANDDEIAEVLEERNIPFDSINEHPFEPEGIGRKMPYDILYDDRVYYCNGYNSESFLRRVNREYYEFNLEE